VTSVASSRTQAGSTARSPLTSVRAYVALTKPRIIELLLITTVPAMILAGHGWPGTGVVISTLVGGSLAAGSANALNCYVDRDIDEVMHRTSSRPLPADVVAPVRAAIFGLVLGVVSLAIMLVTTNLLATALTFFAIAFYVVGYTIVLKRNTAQNIVWGGAAGCMPVLIGWAAVTGSLAAPAFVLFLVVFLWTPPHFWALAMRFKDDYAAAGVPMLPVVADERTVVTRIVQYSWAMVATSLLLVPFGGAGVLYVVCAVASGGYFLLEAHRLSAQVRRGEDVKPMRVFHASITYLTVLFVSVAADQFLRNALHH
jgi:heme o synthase